jgi:hypothetical protein
MSAVFFTVQNVYNSPVVVVTVIVVVAEAEVVIVVAAVIVVGKGWGGRGVEEEEVIRVMYAGRTHEMLRSVIIVMNLKTQE